MVTGIGETDRFNTLSLKQIEAIKISILMLSRGDSSVSDHHMLALLRTNGFEMFALMRPWVSLVLTWLKTY